jgi:hypothetical protein
VTLDFATETIDSAMTAVADRLGASGLSGSVLILGWLLDLIAFNHTTDLIWGHWLPHRVTQNVSHEWSFELSEFPHINCQTLLTDKCRSIGQYNWGWASGLVTLHQTDVRQ